MKNGRIILSIFVLLFIFQLSEAVVCPKDGSDTATIECKQACAAYACPDIIREDGKNGGSGCPEDFYRECSSQNAAIQLIQSKNPNDMDYYNAPPIVLYVSGCGNEIDGRECILNKINNTDITLNELVNQGILGRERILYWRTPYCSSLNETECPTPTAASKVSSTSKESSSKGNSNGQNGALKFIGIFSIGWMLLFAAAWIY